MKIVSMVPSWTETLLLSGVDVVGRTRFCVHPEGLARSVPIVGGTKDINWDKLTTLGADLLLLDQEENPKLMATDSPIQILTTHVRSVNDLEVELGRIAAALPPGQASKDLRSLQVRWRDVAAADLASAQCPAWMSLQNIPVVYAIWRDPWMAAGPSTFIGSMLQKLGVSSERLFSKDTEKYPKFELSELCPGTLVLLSSEPYPFQKKKLEVARELAAHRLEFLFVDGESYSWFGVRSLLFLESFLKTS